MSVLNMTCCVECFLCCNNILFVHHMIIILVSMNYHHMYCTCK